MFVLLFLLTPVTLYLSVNISWNFLWLMLALILSGLFIQRGKVTKVKTPAIYFWLIVATCSITGLVLIAFDVAAIYQVVKSRYFAELGLTFAIVISVVTGSAIFYIFRGMRDGLTPVRQLVAEMIIMINFYIIAVGLATAGSEDSISSQIPWFTELGMIFMILSLVAGSIMAIYNSIIYIRLRSLSI